MSLEPKSSNQGQDLTPEPQTKPTAVVVDDDQVIVMLLQHLLSRRGFEVQVATDGRQAADLLKTLPATPTLVLLDVMLPYFDGFELIKMIREHPTWSSVPIIMLTSKSQELNIVRALDHGANDYIVKPFRPEELLARIRRLTKLP